jgi:hypothetical protein
MVNYFPESSDMLHRIQDFLRGKKGEFTMSAADAYMHLVMIGRFGKLMYTFGKGFDEGLLILAYGGLPTSLTILAPQIGSKDLTLVAKADGGEDRCVLKELGLSFVDGGENDGALIVKIYDAHGERIWGYLDEDAVI